MGVMNLFVGSVSGLAVTVSASMFADVVSPPVGIQVHELAFDVSPDGPYIAQNRTVTANNQLIAVYDTTVSVVTPEGVTPICKGGDYWPYTPGTATARIPFDEWANDNGCYNRLPEHKALIACAVYKWGDGQRTEKCTLGFRKPLRES